MKNAKPEEILKIGNFFTLPADKVTAEQEAYLLSISKQCHVEAATIRKQFVTLAQDTSTAQALVWLHRLYKDNLVALLQVSPLSDDDTLQALKFLRDTKCLVIDHVILFYSIMSAYQVITGHKIDPHFG